MSRSPSQSKDCSRASTFSDTHSSRSESIRVRSVLHASPDLGRGVVPVQQARQEFRSPPLHPPRAEPLRVRIAHRRLAGLELIESLANGVPLTEAAAQQGVDEARLGATPKPASQVHGLVHRRVIGDSVQPEKLVEAGAQENLHGGLLRARPGFLDDQPVQGGGLPDHAVNQFLEQSSVRTGQMAVLKRLLQQVFRVSTLSALSLLEDSDGNFSWFFARHPGIVSDFAVWRENKRTMREEFEKLAAAGKLGVKHIEPLVALVQSGYCQHKHWGFGKIISVDTVFARFLIDFPNKPGHTMDLAFAVDSLRPIPKDHILARKAMDLPGLHQLARANHIELIKTVLESFGGKASLDQIQQILVPDVITSDWKKWWETARREMKKDGHYLIPAKKNAPIVYQEKLVTLQERLMTSFRSAKGLAARTIVASEALQSLADIEDKAAVAKEILDSLNAEIATHLRTQPSVALDAIFARDDLRQGIGREPAEGEIETADVWKQEIELATLLEQLPAAKHRRALQSFRQARPETWPETVCAALNQASARLCGELAHLLISEDRFGLLKETLKRHVNQHSASTELLLWLAKERSDRFADILGPEVFRAMLTAMERDQFNERRSNRLGDFILDDQTLLVELIESADLDVIKDLTRALQFSPCFDDMNKRSLLARIVKSYPSMQVLISGETTARQDTSLLVSWASLERRKNEYDELVLKKIPANSKEIAIARSYGDLSENHEYKAAKEMQNLLKRRKHELETDLDRSRGMDFINPRTDVVSIGTSVTVRDLDTQQVETFAIMGAWDTDAAAGVVSYLTPVGPERAEPRRGRGSPDGPPRRHQTLSHRVDRRLCRPRRPRRTCPPRMSLRLRRQGHLSRHPAPAPRHPQPSRVEPPFLGDEGLKAPALRLTFPYLQTSGTAVTCLRRSFYPTFHGYEGGGSVSCWFAVQRFQRSPLRY